MEKVELFSSIFVRKEWDGLKRMPLPDKGFEASFRDYLYRNISFDKMSDIRDIGLGLSYQTLSDVNHELDVIGLKNMELCVFELKHYEVNAITKEIVFTFLGKVMDFYLKNANILSNHEITMFLVTINKNIDDSIRKLCIAFGIKLIEPSLMAVETMDYFARDLYQKVPEENIETKLKAEELVQRISKLNEYNYSFSDIFKYQDGKILIELDLFSFNPTEIINEIKECYTLFEMMRQTWKTIRN